MPHDPKEAGAAGPSDFIRDLIDEDLASGRHQGVVTRFPPEPNGYLHIGHAKAIVLNFGVAEQYGGRCHLRFDDTNPETEEVEYAESIQRDVRWLGYDWGEHLYFASDYFEQMYERAVELVKKGLAYVDSSTEDEIRERRGTATEPGKPSPYRGRSVEENLDLLRRMRDGDFEDGAHVLRAKGDMAAANIKMRDPLLYRIRNKSHYRTGERWHIYPMYDFAHPLEDAFERITHSLCTLEFENNREVYDWLLEHLDLPRPNPRQIEFARLNLTYTVMSKRKLLQLVKEGHVAGWDDPRMPTLAGLRRRGCTPEAIRRLCEDVGVAKANATTEIERLEHAMRDDLNAKAPRVMGVLRPLKVTIANWPEGKVEWIDAPYWPKDVPREGTRRVPFSGTLLIERDDFMEHPPRAFHRLAPGREVRLRYAYYVRCTDVVKDEAGEVVELKCTYDPETAGGRAPDGRKVKGTIHWVSQAHALPCEVRLYDRLFADPRPDLNKEKDFLELLDPASREVLDARVEPSLAEAEPGTHYQLERQGFFFVDPVDAGRGAPVLNRTVSLKDTWAKIATREGAEAPAEATASGKTKRPAGRRRRDEVPARPAALSPEAERLRNAHGLAEDDARVLGADPGLERFFEQAIARHPAPKSVANWMVNELMRALKTRRPGELPFDGASFGELVSLVDASVLTTRAAKDVLEEMLRTGEAPRDIVARHDLEQVADEDALVSTIDRVIAAHPDEAARYREGKTALLGFFVGQVMRETRGKANPKVVRDLLERRLSAA